jgi:hypothetical protein
MWNIFGNSVSSNWFVDSIPKPGVRSNNSSFRFFFVTAVIFNEAQALNDLVGFRTHDLPHNSEHILLLDSAL